MIGQTISHYQIVEKLGEGGMGVVYKAQDTRLDRTVALKFLPRELTSDPEAKSRFVREAQAASKLDHSNICTVYDVDEASDGSSFIVMAYCDGEALDKLIKRGALSIEQSVDIAIQLCQGLGAAHQKGIVHRDLKPGNVLLTQDCGAKIIDFGLAKLAAGARLTRSGTTVGTAAYMSPEQTRGEDVDARSDIWSMGVILYEMLAGTLPFRGEFESALMYSICNENPVPIETFRGDVPLELRIVLDRALQKEPTKRYQTVAEVVTDLRAIESKPELASVTVSDWQTVSKSLTYILKRRRKVMLIGASVIALIVLGIVFKSWLVKPKPISSLVGKSLAVIPVGTGGGSQQEYFATGFTEELIDALSDLRGVLVISPKSSIFFRESNLSDSSIAARLGVRFLLKIRFQTLAARTKLLASLFDTETGDEAWSSNYDFARSELFTVKETILRTVVDRLGLEESTFKPPRYKTSSELYDTYLQGLHYRDQQTREDNLLAITYMSEVVRRDSQYIPALVSLANAQVEQFRQGWDHSEKLISEAEDNCRRVLGIDSTNAGALALMGLIADMKGNPDTATTYLLKAYDVDPNNEMALTVLGFMSLFETGEPAKGVMYLQKLQEIEPYDWLTFTNIGVAFAQIKNYPEAIRAFHRASQINPNHEWPPYSLGYAYERIGQLDSAEYYYRTALDKNPANAKTYTALISILLVSNKYSSAESTLITGLRYLQSDPEILYDLGLTYELQAKHEPAHRAFKDGFTLIDTKLQKNPNIGEDKALHALFLARLGENSKALVSADAAVQLDSTNEEVLMKVARVYAILGQKQEMLSFFKRAKTMNPEYDIAYVATAMGFEKYRNDPDLLAVARSQ